MPRPTLESSCCRHPGLVLKLYPLAYSTTWPTLSPEAAAVQAAGTAGISCRLPNTGGSRNCSCASVSTSSPALAERAVNVFIFDWRWEQCLSPQGQYCCTVSLSSGLSSGSSPSPHLDLSTGQWPPPQLEGQEGHYCCSSPHTPFLTYSRVARSWRKHGYHIIYSRKR